MFCSQYTKDEQVKAVVTPLPCSQCTSVCNILLKTWKWPGDKAAVAMRPGVV